MTCLGNLLYMAALLGGLGLIAAGNLGLVFVGACLVGPLVYFVATNGQRANG